MKRVPLACGRFSLVDDEDFDRISSRRWISIQTSPRSETRYATRSSGGKTVYMHHEIIGEVGRTDHKDGNGLNNQRNNLRPCSQTQNNANSRTRNDNTSGFRGVSYSPKRGKYEARVVAGGKIHWLGYFVTPEEAARAYGDKANEIFGEFARRSDHADILQLAQESGPSSRE